MTNELKYIAYFDTYTSPVCRNNVPSACDKIDSICRLLIEEGTDVHIISMASVTETEFKFYRGKDIVCTPGYKLKLFLSWGGKSKILRWFKMIWHIVAMLAYLIIHTKKDEPVLAYHSQGYWGIVSFAKAIKHFKLILEVEEVYSDVRKSKFKLIDKLERLALKSADAYIFPTKLMNEKLNPMNKPFAIIHGCYNQSEIVSGKYADGKIHVVYAGTFDPQKGGALASIEAAKFLPSNFHLHVCGFGTPQDIEEIKNKIIEIQRVSKAEVSYDGLKKGAEYISFIQRCHIGLSTQNPNADFNDTSFPSKILSYMANGLSVVTIDIPVVKTSAVQNYLTYYSQQDPKHIADAIMKAPVNVDYSNCFKFLARDFVNQFSKLITKSLINN